MSGVDKFLAGAGKSFVDTGRGAYQIGASLGHAMGLVSDEKMQQIQSDVDESKHLDAPLMASGAGTAGNIVGGMAQMALAPAVTPAALGAIPLAADTAAGALFSGLQPTATGDSRIKNTALGAGAGFAGSLAGKAVGAIAQPIRNALSGAGQSAVDTLTESGVPLDLAQQTGSRVAKTLKNIIADNPIIGPSAFPEEQGSAFNRAVLRTMGITDPSVTAADPETMAAGKKAITDVMDRVAANTKIKYDEPLESALADIGANAPGRASADNLGPVYHNINNILESATNNDGVIPGQVYQRINTNLGGLTSNPANGDIISDVQEALHDALQRSADPQDQADLAIARQRYRAMKQIEGAINPATGDISPGTLINKINTKINRNQSLYGQGDQTLVNLAKAAKTVLAPRNPDSGTARRLAGMAAMGALAGGGDELIHGNPSEALKVGALGAALPLLGRQLVENPTAVSTITGWNSSPVVSAATEALRRGAVAAAPSILNAEQQPDGVARATGGKVGLSDDELVEKLMSRWRKAKRETDQSTKPLLKLPDAAVAAALKASSRGI
jgi:hypothetical protein